MREHAPFGQQAEEQSSFHLHDLSFDITDTGSRLPTALLKYCTRNAGIARRCTPIVGWLDGLAKFKERVLRGIDAGMDVLFAGVYEISRR